MLSAPSLLVKVERVCQNCHMSNDHTTLPKLTSLSHGAG